MCIALAGTLFWSGCKDKDDEAECLGNYPVEGILAHYADDIIVPDYLQFKQDLDELVTAYSEFKGLYNQENLDSVRSKFRKAYIQWQYTAVYEFGPAEAVFYRNSLNNFPLNEGAMETKLRTENYDFSSSSSYDKGFPALDYLFFGYASTDQAIIDSFSLSPKVSAYTSRVLDDMKSRTDQVVQKWVSGGYAQEFIKNTGLAAGQSFSLIVNSLNENFEILRRKRIGIPSGVLSLNFPNPTEVEGLYSKYSLELAKASLSATRRYFVGDEGEGLENVLDFIDARKVERKLSTVILEEFDAASLAMNAIPETLSESVTSNTSLVVAAYDALSPLVVLLKSDMPSVMCIAITYVDNPSDSD